MSYLLIHGTRKISGVNNDDRVRRGERGEQRNRGLVLHVVTATVLDEVVTVVTILTTPEDDGRDTGSSETTPEEDVENRTTNDITGSKSLDGEDGVIVLRLSGGRNTTGPDTRDTRSLVLVVPWTSDRT